MSTGNINDYAVLNFIGTNSNCASYHVKHKSSQKEYTWKAFDMSALTADETRTLLADVATLCTYRFRFTPVHYGHIVRPETKTLYVVTENLTRRTTLGEEIDRRRAECAHYPERSIWSFAYELVRSLHKFETVFDTVKMLRIDLNPNDILIDNGTGVVLDGLEISYGEGRSYVEDVASVVDRMCGSYKKYSNDLKSFVDLLRDGKCSLRSVLVHPVLISRGADETEPKRSDRTDRPDSKSVEDLKNEYRTKLENIRYRESILKSKEVYVAEKERSLNKREKEIGVRERLAEEKFARAELYVRTVRGRRKPSGRACDELNTTLSADEAGEAVAPTVASFRRSASERRVRSAQSSNSGDDRVSRERKKRRPKAKRDGATSSSDVAGTVRSGPAREALVERAANVDAQRRPTSWTDESKKYAFDLLKAMNDKENIGATFKVPTSVRLNDTYLRKTTYF